MASEVLLGDGNVASAAAAGHARMRLQTLTQMNVEKGPGVQQGFTRIWPKVQKDYGTETFPPAVARLCEELCSLNPNVDRLSFSCVWRMQRDGSMAAGHAPRFRRGVIKSCAKLDYDTAQRMIDGEIPETDDQSGTSDANTSACRPG